MKYQVLIQYSGEEYLDVEADSFAEAEEKARELFYAKKEQTIDYVEASEYEPEFEKRD